MPDIELPTDPAELAALMQRIKDKQAQAPLEIKLLQVADVLARPGFKAAVADLAPLVDLLPEGEQLRVSLAGLVTVANMAPEMVRMRMAQVTGVG